MDCFMICVFFSVKSKGIRQSLLFSKNFSRLHVLYISLWQCPLQIQMSSEIPGVGYEPQLGFSSNSDGPSCYLMISKHERWYNNSVQHTSVEKMPTICPPEGRFVVQALIWFPLISFHICHHSEHMCTKFGEFVYWIKCISPSFCPVHTRIPNARPQNRNQSVNLTLQLLDGGLGFNTDKHSQYMFYSSSNNVWDYGFNSCCSTPDTGIRMD
jgi:hypothetical protein